MLNKFNIYVCFDKLSALFGNYTNRNTYRLQNLLILSVKQYIFASKYKQTTTPSLYMYFGCLEKTIIDRLYIEKYLLLKYCKYNEYEKHWQDICNKLYLFIIIKGSLYTHTYIFKKLKLFKI